MDSSPHLLVGAKENKMLNLLLAPDSFFYFCSIYWHEDLGLVKYYYKLCVTPIGIKEDGFEIVCSLSRTRKTKIA